MSRRTWLLMWTAIFLGWWLVAVRCYSAAPREACVIVHRGTGRGSGTIVYSGSRTDAVLTCWHVVRGERGDPVITLWDGRRFTGRLVRGDGQADLCLIEIGDTGITPAPHADAWPMGEPVTLTGFAGGPGTSKWWERQANYVRQWDSGRTISVDQPGRGGDSGAGVFDASGALCGVLWGSKGGNAFITRSQPIASLLAAAGISREASYRTPAQFASGQPSQRPAAQPAQFGSCGPGGCYPSTQPYLVPGSQPAPKPAPPPTQPPPQPTTPTEPTSKDPCAELRIELAAIQKINQEVLAKLELLEQRKPERGPQGAPGQDGADGKDGSQGRPGQDGSDGSPGPRGPAGPAGRNGKDAPDLSVIVRAVLAEMPDSDVDIDVLAAEIAKRLPPMRFRLRDPATGEITSVDARLGDAVSIPIAILPGD